jgi:hypothetical protein
LCYSPIWTSAFSVLCFQTFLFSADIFQFLHFNILLASLSTAFIHLHLGPPTVLFPNLSFMRPSK